MGINATYIRDLTRIVGLTASAPTAAYFVRAFLYATDSGVSMSRQARNGCEAFYQVQTFISAS